MPDSLPPKQEAPDSQKQGWTYDTLNTYLTGWVGAELRRIETMFVERDKAINAALLAQKEALEAALKATQKAIDKADRADDKRFESVNEFRQTLVDQAERFMPRAESLAMHERAREDIAELKERAWQAQGASTGQSEHRTRQQSTTNIIIGVVGVVLAVLVVVLNLIT